MYTDFFGLTEKPFAITPDPRYLFMSERHGEALAHLVYGVTESGGFIQLTGEVGTGKTTLVRTLLGQVPDKADVALILNPQLTAVEFLQTICEELGIPVPKSSGSTKALVDTLNKHLLAAHAKGRRTILLVDEAQNLAAEVLEEVRLLTNLETAKQKLLQIILIGQPELRELLARNDLRQLAQRITGRYHLQPLTRDESDQYINHRMKVAGGLVEVFNSAARKEVFRLSGGIPRIINVICDRALLGAYSRGIRTIDHKLVREAASEVSGEKLQARVNRWLYPLIASTTVILLGLGGFAVIDNQKSQQPVAAPLELPANVLELTVASDIPNSTDPEPELAETEAIDAPVAPGLETVLLQNQSLTGTNAAMRTLFAQWGLEYDPTQQNACAQAEEQGLNCVFQRGTWNVVRQLDRPAILNLTDTAGYEHQVVLTRIGEHSATLAIGELVSEFSQESISDLWYGEYLLLWRPPNGRSTALQAGMRDDSVLWLREGLAKFDPALATTSDDPRFFDAQLTASLKDFQRRNRLKVDGLAGQQTQIILNSGLGLENTPRLSN